MRYNVTYMFMDLLLFPTIGMSCCGTSMERFIVLLLVIVWSASRYSILW